MTRLSLALAVAVAAMALVACGEEAERGERTEATLVLDFVPNAVHAGIYCALSEGYYEDENIELEVVEPTSTSDTLKLIDQGRAEIGLADALDVGQQNAAGLGGEAIMAIVQRPLGGVMALADSGIRRPRDLEGATIGITGVPSDRAVLGSVLEGDGARPDDIDVVSIGFNTVPALQGGRVDAITAYPAADGTALEQRGQRVRSFALDEWGGPTYPGLVAFSTREEIERDPELMQGFVDATIEGYERTIEDPERCLDALVDQVPEIDPELARAQLDVYLPLFEAGSGELGAVGPDSMTELVEFMHSTGLTRGKLPPERLATDEFVD
jgi:NitT/TauT family transport system substrate-binding protein/putative hydroxymethylpyrimidine transport system substrate-binding protein